jgi:hypothetical protein
MQQFLYNPRLVLMVHLLTCLATHSMNSNAKDISVCCREHTKCVAVYYQGLSELGGQTVLHMFVPVSLLDLAANNLQQLEILDRGRRAIYG